MRTKILAFLLTISFSASVFSSTNVFIDGKKIKNSEELQQLLTKQLQIPVGHSVKNLETIYEMLIGDLRTDIFFRIKNQGLLRRKISDQYVDDLIEAVNIAAEDNPRVILILE